MLTEEENEWNFKAVQILSKLNTIPIEIVKQEEGGKIRIRIQKQRSKLRIFLWRLLFFLGLLHWLFMLVRIVESVMLVPEEEVRWDHFVIHFPCVVAYVLLYFAGFRIFCVSLEECLVVFNQLFVQREIENPGVENVDAGSRRSGKLNETKNQDMKITSGKTGAKATSSSAAPTQNPDEGGNSSSISKVRPLFTWPLQYSLDELLARLFWLVAVATEFITTGVFALDPSRSQLLYSALPTEWQNPLSFLLLLGFEAAFLASILSAAYVSVSVQVLFFSKCQLTFQRLHHQLRAPEENGQSGKAGQRDVKRRIRILRQVLQEVKELLVFIQLFNRCFPFVIFAWKILDINLSIFGYFFALRHYKEFPLLAIIAVYFAIGCTLSYIIMYGHAFSIPGEIDELKREFLLAAQKTASTSTNNLPKSNSKHEGNAGLWPEMEREFSRIQNVGVQVGSFHMMERDSTLIFIGFVVQNVVSLLVTFPP